MVVYATVGWWQPAFNSMAGTSTLRRWMVSWLQIQYTKARHGLARLLLRMCMATYASLTLAKRQPGHMRWSCLACTAMRTTWQSWRGQYGWARVNIGTMRRYMNTPQWWQLHLFQLCRQRGWLASGWLACCVALVPRSYQGTPVCRLPPFRFPIAEL